MYMYAQCVYIATQHKQKKAYTKTQGQNYTTASKNKRSTKQPQQVILLKVYICVAYWPMSPAI